MRASLFNAKCCQVFEVKKMTVFCFILAEKILNCSTKNGIMNAWLMNGLSLVVCGNEKKEIS